MQRSGLLRTRAVVRGSLRLFVHEQRFGSHVHGRRLHELGILEGQRRLSVLRFEFDFFVSFRRRVRGELGSCFVGCFLGR
jgi:hypothetical protein